MPETINVKVTSVGNIDRGGKPMVEISGYDNTNNKTFKKAFFETKRDGGRTKNADISDGLSNGDWIEVVMDDTSWKNVQFIKKIAEPAGGASAPTGASAPAAGGGARANSSDKMSKAEWAAKDKRKEVGVARSVAVKAAAIMANVEGKGATQTVIDSFEKISFRIEAYLMKGAFDAELDAEPVPVVTDNLGSSVADAQPEGNQAEGAATSPPAADDDIPF